MRILTLALLLGLAACSPNGSSNAAPQDATDSKAAEASEATDTSGAAAPDVSPPAPAPEEAVLGEPVEPQPRAPSAPAEELLTQDSVDYSCKTNADCEVKNVGNCCGYYPACVNTKSPTFPDKVKAACAAEGSSSICGFPEISGCTCVEGRCAPVSGPGGGGDVR